MKTDLAAAELFNTLNDLWPFYGQNYLVAQLHVEDTVNQQVQQERERFERLLLTHIHLLERGGAYGKAAANHLVLVLKELRSEEERDLDKEEEKQFLREADEAQDEFRRRSFGEGL